jgi:uncharacterized protein DUF3617
MIQSMHPSRSAAFRNVVLAMLAAAGLYCAASRAEGDVDLAMPGLWKNDVTLVGHGHKAKPSVRWHCMLDDADPGTEFATQLSIPGRKCRAGDAQHSEKGLSWSLTCADHVTATARLTFDSNEHYTGSIVSKNREILRVEGQRRAACTDPSD